MTSEQVKLMLVALVLAAGGCGGLGGDRAPAPYGARQVWAVAPLRNESGSLEADGVRLADHLARQLENTEGIDVLPVNRVLAAMQALQISRVTDPCEAVKLRRTLGADGLIVGTITSYDPYDPPKLGLAVELYLAASAPTGVRVLDVRRLSSAPTDRLSRPSVARRKTRPASTVSGFYDAAEPALRKRLWRYAWHRGVEQDHPANAQLYRISMDLYSEFVTRAVTTRLLHLEDQRMRRRSAAADPAS